MRHCSDSTALVSRISTNAKDIESYSSFNAAYFSAESLLPSDSAARVSRTKRSSDAVFSTSAVSSSILDKAVILSAVSRAREFLKL